MFTHAVASHERPTWVTEHLADLVDAHGTFGFHEAYNPDTFEHFGFPADLREQAEASMQAVGINPFTEEQRNAFVSFEQIPS